MGDMGSFVGVVDAFGGVTTDVPRPVITCLAPPLPGEDWRYDEMNEIALVGNTWTGPGACLGAVTQ